MGESKHNTLLWCKVLQGRRHVSVLYYVRPDDGLIVKGRNMSSTL